MVTGYMIGANFSSGTTYHPLIGSIIGSTQAAAQVRVRNSLTWSKLAVQVFANTRAADATTFSLDINNSVSTNVTVSVGAGATGLFEDLTGSESLVSGDLICYRQVVSGGGGTITPTVIASELDGTVVHWQSWENSQSLGAGLTRYLIPVGIIRLNATENLMRMVMYDAATIDRLRVYAPTNTLDVSTTIRVRKNNANGNGVVTFGAGVTGEQEDTTNTDSFAAGDTLSLAATTAAGTGSIALHSLQVRSSGSLGYLGGYMAVSQSAALTRYMPVAGDFRTNTNAESAAQISVLSDRTFSNLRAYATSNGLNSGSATWTLRKNGADTALALVWNAGVTGQMENTTEVAFTASDLINYSLVTGGTTGSFQAWGQIANSGAVVSTLAQSAFRWRNDNGDEDEATWAQSENVDHTIAIETIVRLRAQLKATGDPAAIQPQLEVRPSGSSDPWQKVT